MQVNNIIEVSNLSFSYGNEKVLENISFEIKSGSYIGIIGPNGGGKSTLLLLLLGLLKPQSGSIKIFGQPLAELKNRFEIGYVPQHTSQDNLNFPATVYEVVESGLTAKLTGFAAKLNAADHKHIATTIKLAGLEKYNDKLLSQLSGGQRQRVYVARALVSQPKILILDEPFVGIDISAQANFYAFLRQLNEQHKITIILVSHDVDIISDEIDEVLCLNRRLVCAGDPDTMHDKKIVQELYGKKFTHIHGHH